MHEPHHGQERMTRERLNEEVERARSLVRLVDPLIHARQIVLGQRGATQGTFLGVLLQFRLGRSLFLIVNLIEPAKGLRQITAPGVMRDEFLQHAIGGFVAVQDRPRLHASQRRAEEEIFRYVRQVMQHFFELHERGRGLIAGQQEPSLDIFLPLLIRGPGRDCRFQKFAGAGQILRVDQQAGEAQLGAGIARMRRAEFSQRLDRLRRLAQLLQTIRHAHLGRRLDLGHFHQRLVVRQCLGPAAGTGQDIRLQQPRTGFPGRRQRFDHPQRLLDFPGGEQRLRQFAIGRPLHILRQVRVLQQRAQFLNGHLRHRLGPRFAGLDEQRRLDRLKRGGGQDDGQKEERAGHSNLRR